MTLNMVYTRTTLTTILHKHEWGRIILDECHYIRNMRSKRSQGCHAFKATYKWGLTGTPIQNYKKDLHSLLKFLGMKIKFINKNLPYIRDNYILRLS